MDILSALLGSMTSNDSLSALSGKTGVSNSQLSGLMSQAIPMLMGALQSNASSEAGASSLLNALAQHTSQKPVAQQLQEADTIDGGKILAHILGANSQNAFSQLASANHMETSQVSSVLSSIAPALMSSMSNMTCQAGDTDGLDLASLNGLMGGFDVSSLLGSFMGMGQPQAAQAKPQNAAGGILDAVLGLLK